MAEISVRRFFNTFHVISFIAVAIALIVTVNLQQRQQALVEAENKTRILLQYNLAIHSYFNKQLKPKIFEMSDKVNDSSYFEPSWMSSTFAVREIDKYYKVLSNGKYYYKESAINARSPENEGDDYEKEFIDELKNNASLNEKSSIREIDGKPYYVNIRRGESMERNCLRCHSQPDAAPKNLVKLYGPERSFNRSEGELVSAISIRIPLAEAYASANNFSIKLSVALIIILSLLFVLQFTAMHRLLLKPLSVLGDEVKAIIDDESKLGIDVTTDSNAREINDLIRVFNQLSRSLRDEKDGLVDQVTIKTRDLSEKVALLEAALGQIKRLEGLLPICGYCKKIRDDKEGWHQMEAYISEHSEALFSHGICPECLQIEMDKFNSSIREERPS